MSLSSLIQNKIYNFLLDYITSSDLALAYFTHYLLPDPLICYVPSGLPTVFKELTLLKMPWGRPWFASPSQYSAFSLPFAWLIISDFRVSTSDGATSGRPSLARYGKEYISHLLFFGFFLVLLKSEVVLAVCLLSVIPH